jgi:hypothetical protein
MLRFRCAACDWDLCGPCYQRVASQIGGGMMPMGGGGAMGQAQLAMGQAMGAMMAMGGAAMMMGGMAGGGAFGMPGQQVMLPSCHPHPLFNKGLEDDWKCDMKKMPQGCLSGGKIRDGHHVTRLRCEMCEFGKRGAAASGGVHANEEEEGGREKPCGGGRPGNRHGLTFPPAPPDRRLPALRRTRDARRVLAPRALLPAGDTSVRRCCRRRGSAAAAGGP